MRLLYINEDEQPSLTADLSENIPPYAILSHTWGADNEEVTYDDIERRDGRKKIGFKKIGFCAKQAKKDGLKYFWVDTCCIDKRNAVELQEAITSMFRWYPDSTRCYVYLSDVSYNGKNRSSDLTSDHLASSRYSRLLYSFKRRSLASSSQLSLHLEKFGIVDEPWKADFTRSRWFKRGWTLQELLAPNVVQFFSAEGRFLSNKQNLISILSTTTKIPQGALSGEPLSQFSTEERLSWIESRTTRKAEDKSYSLLGLFDVAMPLIYGEGEEAATERLRKAIHDKNEANALISTHWLVPRSPVASFFGHRDLLETLEKTISSAARGPHDSVQCRIVIWGVSGLGKSELCLQLVRCLRYLFWAVIWIDARSLGTAEDSFLDAAGRLSLPANNLRSAVMSIANLTKPWLLILDDADDLDIDYQICIPESPFGVVLMTSRDEDCGCYATEQPIALPHLSLDDAQALLVKTARLGSGSSNQHHEEIKKISQQLYCHPLALMQAGNFIAQGHCTITEFQSVQQRNRSRIFTFRPRQAQSRHQDMYTTFGRSVETLQTMKIQEARNAVELLSIFAMYGPQEVPLSLFEQCWHEAKTMKAETPNQSTSLELLTLEHVSKLPAICDVDADSWDDGQLLKSLALLQRFSFLSVSARGDEKFASLHPLVHAWAKDRQEPRQQQQAWLTAGSALCLSLRRIERHGHSLARLRLDGLERALFRQLDDHVTSLTTYQQSYSLSFGQSDLIIPILIGCCHYLEFRSNYIHCIALIDHICVAGGLNSAIFDSRYIGLYARRAHCLACLGRVEEAIQILDPLTLFLRAKVSPTDQGTLKVNLSLEEANQHLERLKDALLLIRYLLRLEWEMIPEELQPRFKLDWWPAWTSSLSDQEISAEALFTILIGDMKENLAPEDPNLLSCQSSLAMFHFTHGDKQQAISLLQHIAEHTVSTDNETLPPKEKVAEWLYDKRMFKEAANIMQDMVKEDSQRLEETNEHRIRREQALGLALRKSNQNEQALKFVASIVDVRRRTLEAEHPHRLRSESELAWCLWLSDRKEEALAGMAEVVSICQRVLEAEHVDRRSAEHNLALIQWNLGRKEEALATVEKLVEVQRRILEAEDPLRLESEYDLAMFQWNLDRRQEGLATMEKVVEVERRIVEAEDPIRLRSEHQFSAMLWWMGQKNEAWTLMVSVVEVSRRVLRRDNPDLKNREQWLGIMQRGLGDAAFDSD